MSGIKELINNVKRDILDNRNLNWKEFLDGPGEGVTNFLGRLAILHGVPYSYMVPDEKLLPLYEIKKAEDGKEQRQEIGSLRFFLVDKTWIEYLVSGALSIATKEERDFLRIKTMTGRYTIDAYAEEVKQRYAQQYAGEGATVAQAKAAEQVAQFRNETSDNGALMHAVEKFAFSGFLLRSSLVSAWKGVEVVAEGTTTYDQKKPYTKLHVLRLERMDSDTLFCLCLGVVKKVDIIQPIENPHFGVNVRMVEDKVSYSINSELADSIQVSFRASGAARVLRIDDGRPGSLADKLKKKKQLSSAVLAAEVTRQPQIISCEVEYKPS